MIAFRAVLTLTPRIALVAAIQELRARADSIRAAEAVYWLEPHLWGANQPIASADAAFAAVRVLRELRTIDRADAAWLLERVFETHAAECEAGDPVLPEAVATHWRLDRRWSRGILDESGYFTVEAEVRAAKKACAWRRRQIHAEFYRARGENLLARLILMAPEQHALLCAEGCTSLTQRAKRNSPL